MLAICHKTFAVYMQWLFAFQKSDPFSTIVHAHLLFGNVVFSTYRELPEYIWACQIYDTVVLYK